MNKILNEYSRFLEEKGYGNGVINTYKKHISNFANTLNIAVEDASPKCILDYMKKIIKGKKISKHYISRFVAAFELFYHGMLHKIFKMNFKTNKNPDLKIPSIFNDCDTLLIFKETKNLKCRLFFGIMLLLGLKPQETLAIKIEDYNIKEKSLTIPNARNKTSRKLDVPEMLVKMITVYIRRTRVKVRLFEGRERKAYHIGYIERYFQYVLKICGIEKHLRLESFRNTYIANQIEGGTEQNILLSKLGLKSIRSIALIRQNIHLDIDNIRKINDGTEILKLGIDD